MTGSITINLCFCSRIIISINTSSFSNSICRHNTKVVTVINYHVQVLSNSNIQEVQTITIQTNNRPVIE